MDRRSFLTQGFDPERDLPDVKPEDNPLVWCERCQREHRKFTFTRDDWHTVRDKAVEKLAEAIDAECLKRAMLEIKNGQT